MTLSKSRPGEGRLGRRSLIQLRKTNLEEEERVCCAGLIEPSDPSLVIFAAAAKGRPDSKKSLQLPCFPRTQTPE